MRLLALLSAVLMSGLPQHGWVSTDSTAFLSTTTYTAACPPPPGTIISFIHVDIANRTFVGFNQATTQCDGHVWYGVPYDSDNDGIPEEWWLPDWMVTSVFVPCCQRASSRSFATLATASP